MASTSHTTSTDTRRERDSHETNTQHSSLVDDYEKANLGCGDDYRSDYLNVDLDGRDIGMDGDRCQPDLCHDLNNIPWPFPDNAFDEVVMEHVLEHLDDQLAVLEELHRVTATGGTIVVSGPHWNSASIPIDPTHETPFDPRTFDHYLIDHLFDVQRVELETIRWGRLLPDPAVFWLSDHIGHGIEEFTVIAEATRSARPPSGDDRVVETIADGIGVNQERVVAAINADSEIAREIELLRAGDVTESRVSKVHSQIKQKLLWER